MRHRSLRAVTTILAAGMMPIPSVATVAQTGRYAPVIGNGGYTHLARLNNPVNDANDMAASLRSLGFEVDLITDADLPRMEEGPTSKPLIGERQTDRWKAR